MTWTNWNDNYVFRTGGTDRLFTLASGAAAVALRAQGLEVTKTLDAGLASFNKDSTQVVHTHAAGSFNNKSLVCSLDFSVFRVVGELLPGTTLTLDRAFTGPTGVYPFIVFPGPATGVPALNPQSGVVGRAEDQRIPIEGTVITSASEVAVTLVVA